MTPTNDARQRVRTAHGDARKAALRHVKQHARQRATRVSQRDYAREQHDIVQTTCGHARHNMLTTHKAIRATSANQHATSYGTARGQRDDVRHTR
jgi:prophage DNA circulation protein